MENSNLLRETEIVDFYQPLESEKNLYVSNIVVHLPEGEASAHVQEELHKAFSKFGLLYGVFVCASSHKADTNSSETAASSSNGGTTICEESSTSTSIGPYCCYVFVKFYSQLCAKTAKQQLHMTKIVGVKLCKIQYSRRKKSAGRPKQALFPQECSDVANFYLGFDGWSSAITVMKQEIQPAASESEMERSTTSGVGLSVCRFVCIVEVSFPRHGLMSHGVGIVEETIGPDVCSKAGVYTRCRKKAHREAERDAFSRFLLVVLGNGKVHVELDPTLPDHVNTLGYHLEDPSLIQVNELTEEPIESSSEEDEDDDDSEMIQILAALQEEHTMDPTA